MPLHPLPQTEPELLTVVAELERAKKHGELAEALRALIALAPANTAYTKRLGWLWLELKRPAEARAVFARLAAASGPDQSEARGAMASVLAAEGKHDAAMTEYHAAFAGGLRLPGVLTTLTPLLNSGGRPDLALEAIEMWIKGGAKDPGLLLLWARQLATAGRPGEALATLTQVLSAHPTLTGQEEFQAELLAAAGHPKDAIAPLFRLLGRSFERPDIQALLTTLLRQAYSDAEAETVLRADVARDKANAAAWFQLYTVHVRRGAWREAMAAAEACAGLQPASTLAAGAVARAAMLLGDYPRAKPIHDAIWEAAGKSLAPAAVSAAVTRKDGDVSRVAYLPIEIVGRDFYTRLVIAQHAVDLGFTAVVLPHSAIKRHAADLPPGVILHKSMNAFDVSFFEDAASAGHIVTAIDEEAFGWIGDYRSVMRGADPRCYGPCTAIFAPGDNYTQEISRRHAAAVGKLVTTGNPRTDILAPAFRALHADETAAARAAHGPNVLLTTNFGLWNSAYDQYSSICKLALTAPGAAFEGADRAWLVGCYKSAQTCETETTAALRAALEPLAKALKGRKLILRPHPVENADTWTAMAAKVDNVVVDASRTFPAQALAADAVIHLDGCGTGLEAALLGRPTVCLAPVDGLLDPSLALSSKLSPRARDAASLIDLVLRAVQEGERAPTPEQAALIDAHLHRPGRGVGATIAQHLSGLLDRRNANKDGDLHGRLQTTLESIGGKMKLTELKETHTFSVKRVKVSEAHIEKTLADIRACTGHGRRPKVARIADGYYVIS